jgi:hypothetical protein
MHIIFLLKRNTMHFHLAWMLAVLGNYSLAETDAKLIDKKQTSKTSQMTVPRDEAEKLVKQVLTLAALPSLRDVDAVYKSVGSKIHAIFRGPNDESRVFAYSPNEPGDAPNLRYNANWFSIAIQWAAPSTPACADIDTFRDVFAERLRILPNNATLNTKSTGETWVRMINRHPHGTPVVFTYKYNSDTSITISPRSDTRCVNAVIITQERAVPEGQLAPESGK